MGRWGKLPDEVVEIIGLRLDDPLPVARAALLREPPAVQREAVISLVDRHTDPMRTPFQDIDPSCSGFAADRLGQPGDPWLVSGGLLDAIPQLPGWTLPDLRRLLRGLSSPYAVYGKAEPAIRAVLRQLNGVETTLLAQLEYELTAFAGALGRPNEPVDPDFTAELARSLPARNALDNALDEALGGIVPGDDWGVKCVVAIRHEDLKPSVVREVVAIATLAGGSGRPDRWHAQLNTLLASDDAATIAEVTSVLERMATTIAGMTWRRGWMPFLPWAGNEKIAAGSVAAYGWWAARTTDGAARADVGELCDRLAWWGARWDDIRPMSAPVARGAVAALGEVGGDAAVVALHRLQERFGKRPGLGKYVDAALEHALADSPRSLVQILTASGPWFGLDADGHRRWPTDRGSITLTLDPPDVVIVDHPAPASVPVSAEPSTMTHTDALAEADVIRRSAEAEIGVLIRRYDTALRERRSCTREEFTELALVHPVSGAVARRLIWEFETGGDVRAGVPRCDGTVESPDGDWALDQFIVARLWHPLLASPDELRGWRAWARTRALHQPVRQIDRETFRLADFRPIAGTVSFGQVEGILRSRGWRVPRLDRWDGGDEGLAFMEEPSSGFRATVGLTGDLDGTTGPVRCWIGRPDVNPGRLEPGDSRVAVLVSEALRDLALVAAKARPAG